MDTKTDPAELAQCLSPLDDEGRRAVRQYWETVIRDEHVPAERRTPRLVPTPDLDERRERRRARRAMALVASSGRTAALLVDVKPVPLGGEAA